MSKEVCLMVANNQIKHIKRFSMEKEQIKAEIETLKAKLTGDMFQDMDIKDQIHNLEMKLNGTKPTDSHFDCVGCGS